MPPWALVLDLLGTLLLAVGIYGMVGGDDLFLAEQVNLRQIAIPLIVIGVLMMAPLVVVFVQRSVARK